MHDMRKLINKRYSEVITLTLKYWTGTRINGTLYLDPETNEVIYRLSEKEWVGYKEPTDTERNYKDFKEHSIDIDLQSTIIVKTLIEKKTYELLGREEISGDLIVRINGKQRTVRNEYTDEDALYYYLIEYDYVNDLLKSIPEIKDMVLSNCNK